MQGVGLPLKNHGNLWLKEKVQILIKLFNTLERPHLRTYQDIYELFSISGLLSRIYDDNSTLRNRIDEITK